MCIINCETNIYEHNTEKLIISSPPWQNDGIANLIQNISINFAPLSDHNWTHCCLRWCAYDATVRSASNKRLLLGFLSLKNSGKWQYLHSFLSFLQLGISVPHWYFWWNPQIKKGPRSHRIFFPFATLPPHTLTFVLCNHQPLAISTQGATTMQLLATNYCLRKQSFSPEFISCKNL